MSFLSLRKATFGFSNTASENHFLDGSVANKLSIKRGTPNSPGATVLDIDAGVVSFPQNPVQTWQDVKSSRVFGTTYTNSTGQPIKVSVSLTSTLALTATALVAGVVVQESAQSAVGYVATLYFDVPAGATYSINQITGGGITLNKWMELR